MYKMRKFKQGRCSFFMSVQKKLQCVTHDYTKKQQVGSNLAKETSDPFPIKKKYWRSVAMKLTVF